MTSSFLSPKVELCESPTEGKGLFAKERILKGELVVDFTNGPGTYISTKEADALFAKGSDHMIQVDDDLFLAAADVSELEDADYINHSCEPNCGIKDALRIVAMRDIESGKEVSIDYAMMESSDFSFACNCGAQNCRGKVTGNDWKSPELQEKYGEHFSEYLKKRMRAAIGKGKLSIQQQ